MSKMGMRALQGAVPTLFANIPEQNSRPQNRSHHCCVPWRPCSTPEPPPPPPPTLAPLEMPPPPCPPGTAGDEPRLLARRRLRGEGGPAAAGRRPRAALRSCRRLRTPGEEKRARGAPPLSARYCHRPHPRPGRRSSQEPAQGRSPPETSSAPAAPSSAAAKNGAPGANQQRGPEEARAGAQYQQLRKEVLKSKMGKLEKITVAHGQAGHNMHKCEQLNTIRPKSKCSVPLGKLAFVKRNENASRQDSVFFDALRKPEKPLRCTDNLCEIKLNKTFFFSEIIEKEINYAGAKFSDPPSPSVLPKPPRHWVGTTPVHHSDHFKELMAVHLKTLLKVQS